MTPKQLITALHIARMADVPLLIMGSPGQGKSQMVQAYTDATDSIMDEFRAPMTDALDLGLPHIEGGVQKRARLDWWPEPNDPPHIVFLDELLQGTQMTMNALSELILDRRIGGRKGMHLRAGDWVCAASNLSTDRAATFELPSHLKNRFCTVTLQTEWDDVKAHWESRGGFSVPKIEPWEHDKTHPYILAFLRNHPNLLFTFSADEDVVSFATPRSWEMLARLLPGILQVGMGDFAREMICGTIGDKAGIPFSAFCASADIPDVMLVFERPENAPIPKKLDTRYLYVYSAIFALEKVKKGKAFMAYLQRVIEVDREFGVSAFLSAHKRYFDSAAYKRVVDSPLAEAGSMLQQFMSQNQILIS